ncbi:DUF1376 domain-containing protein [Collimonas pratensis]|uniref:DUF1376 domain-containing protein n=1 Tax=Collimonas pratensis TaxID=279113 RepID=UPI0007849549|nr:DUF1376 domain-containing protein [Collimonas pratensis]
MSELPTPLSPEDCDLRDFPFLPLDIARLFNSEFHARSNDTEWRAGVTLWLKSFHQVPAGSIPDDDVQLARLAELGRDTKTWKKVKGVALHGWIKCNDGRLYHPVVAEKAAEALAGKKTQRGRTAKGRLQVMLKRLSQASDMVEFASAETSVQTVLSELSQYLSQTEFDAVSTSVTDSVTEAKRKREGQRKGEEREREREKKRIPILPDRADSRRRSQRKIPKTRPSRRFGNRADRCWRRAVCQRPNAAHTSASW